jgi:hypothetical protein
MPSTQAARDVGEERVRPELPDALEREAKKLVKGLQLPKGNPRDPESVIRHVPFRDDAADVSHLPAGD